MRGALAFLTPLGGAAAPDQRTMRWFPVVGLALGAVAGLVWWAAGKAWPGVVAAALAVLADLALTGLLHLDGLADSADGLLPPLPRQRRLEVMATPDVGAFGVGAVVIALVLRVVTLAAVPAHVALLAGLWCGSRSLMVVATGLLPYARVEGGLASAFVPPRNEALAVGAGGIALAVGFAAWGRGWGGAVAVVGLLAGGGAVLWLAARRLGGFTGDVLGAAGMVGETLALVVAAARW